MKRYLQHKNLPWLTLICGGIGLLLQIWLLSTENSKGFITRWHISEILLVVLTVLFLLALLAATRSLTQGSKYSFNFPASRIGAAGTAIAAVGIAVLSGLELTAAPDNLARICWLAGLPSAIALVLIAYGRLKGRRPSVLLHAWLCVWLVLLLVCQYRSWSSDPQLEDYCYRLLALVFAMISVYHRATFGADFGRRSSYAFFCLGCVYFCCLSIAGPGGKLLYPCLGIWQLTDLCRLAPMPRRYRRNRHEAA